MFMKTGQERDQKRNTAEFVHHTSHIFFFYVYIFLATKKKKKAQFNPYTSNQKAETVT